MTTNGLIIKDHDLFFENLKKIKSAGFHDHNIFNIALFLSYFPLKEKRWKVFDKLDRKGKYAIIMNHLHGMAIKEKINSYILNSTTTTGLSYYKDKIIELKKRLNEVAQEEPYHLEDKVRKILNLKDIEANISYYKNENNRRYFENLESTNILCILLVEQKQKEEENEKL